MTKLASRLLGMLAAAMLLAVPPALGNAVAAASNEWQADPFFYLDHWQVPGFEEQATTAGYRLLDPQGNQIGAIIRQPSIRPLTLIEVPAIPGIYTVEGWLEDDEGQLGPPRTATLRFDDTAPAPPVAESPERWLLGTEQAVLKIAHPTGPFPLSGIRGYAISLDLGSGGTPCSVSTWCSLEETDLDEGIDDDVVSLGTLPEGTTYARVAAVSGAGVASSVSSAVFRVDATRPSVSIHGVRSGWSAGPVRVTASADDHLSGMAAVGAAGPFTAIAVDGAAPTVAWGDRATAWIAGSGIHRVETYARDAAGNLSGGDPEGPPPASAIVRIDEEPPQILFSPAQDPTEPERIEATLSDAYSGADPSRGSIMVRLAGTRARFEELPTKTVGGTLVARWDSDSYPPGKYEFLAVGFDLAGNAGAGTNRDRGGRMVLLNPLKGPVSLTGQLIGQRFAGRLRAIGGDSVARLEVKVVETFAAGSQPQRRITSARTGADGSFAVRLRPGPSRDVAATFAGSPVLTRASSATRRLAVSTGVRFRASAREARIGGGPIVFSGRVDRSGASAKGLPVELQFRYPGSGWIEFRTLEADARGRFRYAYGFSDDDSRGIRFQFRAHVPGREGWPYEPGSSRPVLVTGR
ncbi:MAG TPA: hypothetical protein VFM51_09645 [Solirubrobacterales bacterium]|nr:hypothetical protein [Solirubrobacterales bacterium]